MKFVSNYVLDAQKLSFQPRWDPYWNRHSDAEKKSFVVDSFMTSRKVFGVFCWCLKASRLPKSYSVTIKIRLGLIHMEKCDRAINRSLALLLEMLFSKSPFSSPLSNNYLKHLDTSVLSFWRRFTTSFQLPVGVKIVLLHFLSNLRVHFEWKILTC